MPNSTSAMHKGTEIKNNLLDPCKLAQKTLPGTHYHKQTTI